MTDILQAAQQQINDAAGQTSQTKAPAAPPPPAVPPVNGPTPFVGSASGRVEPPIVVPAAPPPPPLPTQKTGSSIDLTNKTEPVQSPPLPMPPPDSSLSSGGWSPDKAKIARENLKNEAPIANIPQYDNAHTTTVSHADTVMPPKTYQPPKISYPPVPPPLVVTPVSGSGTPNPPPISPPPPPNIPVTGQTVKVVPPPKKPKGRGVFIAIILLLAAAIPVGVYIVTSGRFNPLQSQAIGDLRYLCTPNACAVGGCNQPCTANLAGTQIVWDGNAYQIPANGYAIKNKCYGVESGATNSACSCPRDHITDAAGSGDTCDLPDIERYFMRGPATLGWDDPFCGTQQVDITVGSGNPSYFHTREDTRPETCNAPSPTLAPVPQCDNGALFKVYDGADGSTDITDALRNGTRRLQPGEIVIVAVSKVAGADHARFRLQGYGDWIRNNDKFETETEFRNQINIPENFNGTNGAFEADICSDATDTSCK